MCRRLEEENMLRNEKNICRTCKIECVELSGHIN